MKQRITIQDINKLSREQIQNLNTLWAPGKYDVVVAKICKDIVNEEYENYEFVIGNIGIYNGYRIMLYDILSPQSENESDSDEDNSTEGQNGTDDQGSNEDESNEAQDEENTDDNEADLEFSDLDFSYTRPSSFMKDECVPLLSIGQMLSILDKNNPSSGDFYVYADTGDDFCEIGNSKISNDYGIELKGDELCDVLWKLIKSIL